MTPDKNIIEAFLKTDPQRFQENSNPNLFSKKKASEKNNILHWVAYINNIKLLRDLVSLYPVAAYPNPYENTTNLWGERNKEGDTPQHYIAFYADTDIYTELHSKNYGYIIDLIEQLKEMIRLCSVQFIYWRY